LTVGSIKHFVEEHSLIKVLFLMLALLYVVFHLQDLSQWLSTITHGEVFGVKFDRKVADEKVAQLNSSKASQSGGGFAQGAVARAAHVGSTVAGARILWLDVNLPNNVAERQVLEAMNISVQRVLSITDAKNLARQAVVDHEPYDLIISDVTHNPETGKLVKCPVSFTQIPEGVDWRGTIGEFNASQISAPYMGFAFAEWLATDSITGPAYFQSQRPRLIFYTGTAGGKASTVCARIITNYADVLLQNVVSALEETRWEKLPPLPISKAPKTPDASRKSEEDEHASSNQR
jgi:hypothetical protein